MNDLSMTQDSSKTTKIRRQPKQARSQERVSHILDAAEQLFIEVGYEQATTRAIALRAAVPVGSLYQFFPDKEALLRALANRYFEQEYHLFVQLQAELTAVPIQEYVDRVIDAFDQFATDHPGYQVVLAHLVDLMTIADASNPTEYDRRILAEFAQFLAHRNPALPPAKCELIATTTLNVANELLWLALRRDRSFRSQLLAETKTLITAYLQTHQV
ncbi:MAG: TetR/AcrR family transcriptional regulator [Leptolyngbyaceae cyanobacterium bins.302]|nr:TetR/AcrR family transcriptional regulator [Leptolyngbyaceae cyanobacterium bins.302]